MTVKSAIACLDVAYGQHHASAACALIDDWDAATASQILCCRSTFEPAPYEPGAFYKRELAPLRSIIAQVTGPLEAIVIDGYVWLGGHGEPGLGAHLFRALGHGVPVIGIAKSRFQNDTWSIPVTRGGSDRPLFVTAVGMAGDVAARALSRMHGAHRIPTVLRLADQAAREGLGRAEKEANS